MMKMIGHIFKRHRRITRILAALVVFLTTYALILPALTLDKETAVEQSGVTLGRGDESVHSDDEQGSDLGKETLAGLSQTSEDDINSSEEKAMLITEPTTLTFESEQYTVKVRIDDRAKLPSDVTLRVSELTPESRQIKQEEIYRQLGDGVFGVHFYDISLWSKDKEVEPAGPVEVEVSYKTPLEISRQYSLMAIHYHPEAGAEFLRLDAKRKDKQISSVSFTTDHFSEYGFVQALPKAINAAVNDGRTLFNIIFQSDGQEITSISDVESGTPIGQLPENPFKEGYRFDSWKNAKTGEPVTSETLVTEDMLVEAVFVPISIYTISVEYYYHNNSSHQDVVFDKETYQKEEKDTPLQITPPASTKVSRGEDPTLQADSVYYPEKSIVEIAPGQLADLDSKDGQRDNHVTLKVQFVPSTATFEYVYLLKNLTGNGYSEMKRVEAHGVLNSTVYPQVLTFPNANFERTEAKEITQASGQKLNVYYTRKSYNLSYETNGGSYIDPQTGLYEQEIPITKTIPTRTGYDFAGWYDNPSFSGRAVTRSTKLSSDKTLYAKWTPRKVNYTIAYYREVYDNATGTTSYVYESSRLAQATVGDTIQATSATVPGLSSSSIPTGYEKERAYGKNASSSVTIEPDGTSVLNVYYSLKRYTFIFDLNGPVVNNWGRTISNSIGSSRGVININNGAYTNRQYVVRDVVMDQDISNLWPTGDQIYDSLGEYSFKGWKYASDAAYYVTRRQKVTPDLVTLANSNNEITYSAYWQRGLITKRVEYYLESPEGDYVLSNEHSQTYQTTRKSNLSGKNISGFTYYYERNINYPYSNDVATYRFYYKRDRYKINYMYGSQTVKTTPDIPFDANINTSDYNYRPTRPKGVDSDYTWGGWYADAGLNTPYQFTTMPANHLVLYAKWIAPTFKVNFDLNGADGQAPNSQQVEKYKTVTVPPNPSREHYDFVGWYTEPTGGSRYDWSKPVTTDSTLYARWRPKPITYTVKYLEEGTETPLATEKVESNPAFVKGQTISEKALAISGYRPAERSQSIQLDHGKNVITFYYTKKAPTVTYTIKYVLADNPAIEVAPSQTKVVDGSWLSAKEKAVPVDKEHFGKQAGVTPDMLALDYYPIDNVEELVLSSVSQNNVITFRYANYETAKIKVNYLDMDGNPIPGQDSLTVLKKKPGSYSVNRKAISGYTFEKSIDNQKAENKTYYKIINGDQIEVNLYYKKNLTLQAQDKQKVYDGNSLESSGLADLLPNYTTQLIVGDQLKSVRFEGSQTKVGSSQTKPVAYQIVDTAGQDRNYYYKVVTEPGRLSVTPLKATVIINGERKEKTYDGKAETVSYSMELSDPSNLLKKSDIVFDGKSSSIRQKDAGVYDLNLVGQFKNNNLNIEVTFQIANGQLKINPRKVILTSKDASKAYDGSALVSVDILISDPGFVAGEGVSTTVTGSQTLPGKSQNTFTYQLKPNTNASNYEIETQFGQLKVQPTLNLQKTDQSWQALSGGKFRVTRWNGNMWEAIDGAYELVSNGSEGINLPNGISQGLYRIEELAAPDGYIVLGQDVYFKVEEFTAEDDSSSHYVFSLTDEAGTPHETNSARLMPAGSSYSHRIQIMNEPGRALPHTGGAGHQLILLVGTLLTGTALYGFYKRSSKKNA